MTEKLGFEQTAAQTAAFMAILILGSKLFGFAREMIMANYFGTSYVVDAYAMAFSILSLLFGGLIAAISTAYMPIFSQISVRDGIHAGHAFTGGVIRLLILASAGLSIIGFFISDEIVALMARGFSGETAHLTVFFVKIFFFYILFSSVAGILEAGLQYKGTFLPQIVGGYCVSICIIVAIVISAKTSYYWLAFGTVAGHGCKMGIDLLIARKKGFSFPRAPGFKKSIKSLFLLSLPVFVGGSIQNVNLFIDRMIASGLEEGSIAALNYASLLNLMIVSLTATVLSTLIYPALTKASAELEYERFERIASRGVSVIVIICLPCAFGAMLYSRPVIQFIYQRGAFDISSTDMTSAAFFYYAMGLLFLALNDLLIKIYYAMGDTKRPMIFGGITVILNIVLNLLLAPVMFHAGLALATSIAAFANSALLFGGLRKSHSHINLLHSKEKLIKIILAAGISVGLSYLANRLVAGIVDAGFLQLFLAVLAAGGIYLVLLHLFKIDEVKLIRKIFRKG